MVQTFLYLSVFPVQHLYCSWLFLICKSIFKKSSYFLSFDFILCSFVLFFFLNKLSNLVLVFFFYFLSLILNSNFFLINLITFFVHQGGIVFPTLGTPIPSPTDRPLGLAPRVEKDREDCVSFFQGRARDADPRSQPKKFPTLI